MSEVVLVVDDEAISQSFISTILNKNGYEVKTASTAYEALQVIRENEIDAVLCDIIMPEITGYELCASILEIDRKVPVIMITALIEDQALKKAFDAGACDYIRKPVSEIELLSRLRNIISARQSESRIATLYRSLLYDLETAQKVQSFLVPGWIEFYDHVICSSCYHPASKVSGDLFDVIPLKNNRYLVYVADISGHGIQAALQMTAVESLIMEICHNKKDLNFSPADILQELNWRMAVGLFTDNYMTVFMTVLDFNSNEMAYYNAGHQPILIYDRRQRKIVSHDCGGGIPLGWEKDFCYEKVDEGYAKFNDETSLLLFTDGITESEDNLGNQVDLNALSRLAKEAFENNSMELVPAYIMDKLICRGHLFNDDVVLLALEMQKLNKKSRKWKVNLKLSEVSSAGREVEHFVMESSGSSLLPFKAELVANEVLNNIILHGSAIDRELDFAYMTVDCLDDDIVLNFYDRGGEWKMERKRQDDDLESFSVSGRGLMMIDELSKSMESFRVGNINVMRIVLEKEAECQKSV